MKTKFIGLIALCLMLSTTLFAVDYPTVMNDNIGKMYRTTSADTLTSLAASFDRIAQIAPGEWLPYYYSAYCYVTITFTDKDADRTDANLDKAQVYLDKSLAINDMESELYVLQALIHSMRITNAGRGYKYSTLSNESLSKAEALNSNNPRIYFCKGQNVMNTPAMFGGGKDKALLLFEKSKSLFESQTPTNALMPMWGQKPLDQLIADCKK